LDWTLPVQRPDAISTELAAKFLRVANLLGHRQAADFARHNLNGLRQGDQWPVAVTTAATNAPLQTGLGRFLYPAQKELEGRGQIHPLAGWPETLGVYAELADSAWPVSSQARSELTTTIRPTRDLTLFLLTAAGFYLSTVVVALSWWGLSFARRRRRAKDSSKLAPGLLVPKEVMQKAEERWAKRVLGMCIPAGAERTRYSNGAVEQNFHMQLRANYKLVIEWRRLVNNWSENDARLAEDDSDEWLNGMDEFAAMVGIYARWVVKAGRKDGLRQADVLQHGKLLCSQVRTGIGGLCRSGPLCRSGSCDVRCSRCVCSGSGLVRCSRCVRSGSGLVRCSLWSGTGSGQVLRQQRVLR
jgi:hypothetical protein